MRFLFVKARLEWPRTHGHDVHCFEMMKALAALGHDVALATDVPTTPDATAGLSLAASWVLEDQTSAQPVAMTYLQERYRSYWGIAHGRIAHLRRLTTEWKPDAVVVVGLEILPYLAAPQGPARIWYAADEWVWHYVSQLGSDPRHAVTHLKQAAIKGLYERAFASAVDRVWVVSPTEKRAMRIVTGTRNIDVVPNGVDTETFAARDVAVQPRSAVFWGRLGFGPNLQALRWFLTRVWPTLRARVPDAEFAILGADPPDEVLVWHGRDGVTVTANPDDLRPEIARRAVVVLPFVSGGGIKNKFLEAAAMSRPIVATARSTRGLRNQPPVVVAGSAGDFAAAVLSLWHEADRGALLGAAARRWVVQHHTWKAAAEEAVAGLNSGR
jgi:glycosyltransferase involved in cell wall biosynthesis